MKPYKRRKPYIAIATLITWFAIVLQFNLSLDSLHGDTWSTLKLFLSYFTVLTNILAAICLTTLLLFESTPLGKFFSRKTTLTAITVYILVVGLVYNIALRGLASPSGLAMLANELLHVANPLLFLGFWIFFVDKRTLEYTGVINWLIYPLFYILFIVVRGHFIKQYPYPFINVVELGYPKAILNTVILLFVFWSLSLIFVFIGKKLSKI